MSVTHFLPGFYSQPFLLLFVQYLPIHLIAGPSALTLRALFSKDCRSECSTTRP